MYQMTKQHARIAILITSNVEVSSNEISDLRLYYGMDPANFITQSDPSPLVT